MSVLDKLIGLLAPHDCLGCGEEGSLLCLNCRQALPSTEVEQAPDSALLRMQAATPYTGVAKDLIWQLKSGGAQAGAEIMADLMAPLLSNAPKHSLIVPVPTATRRARQRGYDQAKLIARRLSRRAGLPYYDCLGRHGQAHQVGAHRHQRLEQLRHALRVKKSVGGLNLILVDDVTTTGATLETAAKVLRQAGAKTVEAVTFAYAPKLIK